MIALYEYFWVNKFEYIIKKVTIIKWSVSKQ